MFDAVDKPFDQISTPVLLSQRTSLDRSPGPRGNHRPTPTASNRLDEIVAIIGLVRDDVLGSVLGQQRRGLIDVMLLAGGEDQFDGLSLGIDGQVQLTAETAPRTPEGLVAPFFVTVRRGTSVP